MINKIYSMMNWVAGSGEVFPLRHQILNVTEFVGFIIFFQASIVNYFFHFPFIVILTTAATSLLMLIVFYYSRMKKYYRVPVFATLSSIVFLTGPMLWINNAGLNGSIPYWYIYLAVAISVLTTGWPKRILIVISIIIVLVLSYSEYAQWITIVRYSARDIRYFDVFPQLILVMIVLVFLVSVIIKKYRNEHEKVLRYADELLTANKKMEIMVNTDFLTRLFNRSYILDKIEYEKKKMMRTGKPFSIILADIDDFKKINDTYGHNCGDFILKNIALDIMGSLRKSDTAARWGGEEFLLLLPETNINNAKIVAEKIRRNICEKVYISEKEQHKVTLSMGLSVFSDPKEDKEIHSLIKEADVALYEGKKSGKNRVVVF